MNYYNLYYDYNKIRRVEREELEEYLSEICKIPLEDLYLLSNKEIKIMLDDYHDDIVTYCWLDIILRELEDNNDET